MLADTYKVGACPGCGVRRSGRGGGRRGDCIDRVGQLCGDREHVFGRRPPRRRCGGWWISVSTLHICPVREARAAARAAASGGRSRPLAVTDRCTSTSTPRWSSTIPTTRPRRHRPGRSPSATTHCWRFWTARRSPAVSRWPGCCAKATPAPTPPPTTSRSSTSRWRRCRPSGVPTWILRWSEPLFRWSVSQGSAQGWAVVTRSCGRGLEPAGRAAVCRPPWLGWLVDRVEVPAHGVVAVRTVAWALVVIRSTMASARIFSSIRSCH